MRKLSKKLTFFVAALFTTNLQAVIGCLDNSYHGEKRNDFKNYHGTACNCQCWKHKWSPDRNKCTKCGHYHDHDKLFYYEQNKFKFEIVGIYFSNPKKEKE